MVRRTHGSHIMHEQRQLDDLAQATFALLKQRGDVLVTAESCTAGLIAATLARVPGMSTCLAGSFVVYQIDSKIEWLNVSAELIERYDVVSKEVAECMATQALLKTLHATIAISITGHLGPNAPDGLDGIAWLGFSNRRAGVQSVMLTLNSDSINRPSSEQRLSIRHERQQDAVRQVLSFLCERLAESA
jgi:nicotinamide-nucleotide amidase